MANKRMLLSAEGKEILDTLTAALELDRPTVVHIALAKGIAENDLLNEQLDTRNRWTIPDNIIKEKDFLLFKHLIIQKADRILNDDELHKYMIILIENGLRIMKNLNDNKTSMQDLRLLIL
ncbi:hypothetical protein HNQ44_001680 [Planomicrobium koreense]|uniref:Uncharacterized protein n=1 Tax=Planococcus koreensis TaxID=112331 RepID=A0A7W8CRE9_9BACL|nr:hypothetical protein [Planococcus koreensis]MBB5180252.1 hypothetical protein [Planococcus koreensis]